MAHRFVLPHVTLRHAPGGDSSVLSLHGEHDIATAPRVRDALRVRALRRTLVVDLGDCSFLDGSILGLLIGAQSRVTRRGGTVLVVNASGVALRALQTLSSTHALTVYDGRGTRISPSVPEAA